MEVQTTVAAKKLGFFSSKRTNGDSYSIIEGQRSTQANTSAGPENEVASLVEFLTSPELEPSREARDGEKGTDVAQLLAQFVLRNKEKIVYHLESDLAMSMIPGASTLPANADESQKIVAQKQAKMKAVRQNFKRLKTDSRFLESCLCMSTELRNSINTFLDTLEHMLLGGDLEQLKVTHGAVLAVTADHSKLSGKQVNNTYIISEGGLYETSQLTPSIQKEFTQAQKDYNLTALTKDLPPKIVKTPPAESLSPFLPTVVVLFHTDLLLEFVLSLVVYSTTAPRHPKSFDKYGKAPEGFLTDEYFMTQRVIGVNPCGITKMTPETKGLFTAVGVTVPSDTNNCYVWDFRILDQFTSEHMPSSVLLAHFDTKQNVFKPLAVWAKPGPGTTVKPVVIKRDDGVNAWEFGKMCVRVSEWSVHEIGSHLSLCHFVSEMGDVITHHCLPKQHPVFQLLLPHFFRTIPLNDDARATLVPTVISTKLSAMDEATCWKFCSVMIENWNYQNNYVPGDLERRGVTQLPETVYPFRKTALDTWNCVRTYVQNALALVASMAESGGTGRTIIDTDMYLRDWARMMRKNFTNFPDLEGANNTNEALYDALTLLIYTASHQHAAVNYFQAKYMSFLPAAPGHMTSFPADFKNLSDSQLVKLFPSYQAGMLQRAMGKMLSTAPEYKHSLAGFSREPKKESPFSVEWPQLDNDLKVLQAQLKDKLAVYSLDSVSQKTLAQSVLI